jgi:hypothetical protein
MGMDVLTVRQGGIDDRDDGKAVAFAAGELKSRRRMTRADVHIPSPEKAL